MNSQQISFEVHCANALDGDVPKFAQVTISKELNLRIRSLARAVRELNVDRLALFEHSMAWYDSEEGMSELQVEVPMLVVQGEVFWWEAIPKGCGDDMKLSTEPVSITRLYGGELPWR